MFDPVHYYAFVLDALSRFPNEGRRLAPSLWSRLPGLRGNKPTRRLLAQVAARMNALGLVRSPSSIFEFGVYKGYSSRILAGLFPQSQIYGFDTFAGLPDDGRPDWKVDFRVSSLPDAPANVEFVVGRFEDTLATFLERPELAPMQLIHIDCDIYSSTRYVLTTLGDRLTAGTVIVFDELLNYNEFPENELLAFYEFLQRHSLDFEWFLTIGDAFDFDHLCKSQHPQDGFIGYRKLQCYQNACVILVPDKRRAERIAHFLPQAAELLKERPLRQPLLDIGACLH